MRRCTCKRASVISLNINCSRINNISHMTRHLRPDTQELIVPNFRIRQLQASPALLSLLLFLPLFVTLTRSWSVGIERTELVRVVSGRTIGDSPDVVDSMLCLWMQ
jgi:hypothetical protein